MKNTGTKTLNCSTSEMVKYGLGGCVESLILNSFFGFSMFYYTKALGLSPDMAAIATAIATFWDAVSDPIMGHISDNTQSRYGKRYPYIMVGGITMVITFFFIWYVPDFFKNDLVIGWLNVPAMTMLFLYLVVMNLLLRTTYTIFIVPYTALGFEICDDYDGRSRVQGIRTGLNMAANFCGPAMAWWVFFNGNTQGILPTQIAGNYVKMGSVFTVVSFIFLMLLLWFIARYIEDSRNDTTCHKDIISFFRDMKEIILDKYPRWVFIFIFCVLLGIVLVSNLQMYVFDDFMKLTGFQKMIAHGGTMVGMGLGSLSLAFFIKRFDKKGAIYAAVGWSVFCELVLGMLFLTGFLKPGQFIFDIPVAFILFAFFHGAYWFGNGIMLPVATSMMADVSEIHQIQTGVNKDGSYAAMFSLAMKISMTVGSLITGYGLLFAGFKSGADAVQSEQSVWRVCALTFVVGPMASLAALCLISKYPITKGYIEKMKENSMSEKSN